MIKVAIYNIRWWTKEQNWPNSANDFQVVADDYLQIGRFVDEVVRKRTNTKFICLEISQLQETNTYDLRTG